MLNQHEPTAWLKGGAARCAGSCQSPARSYRLVLLGAPGVGKGTQAELLCQRLGTCHLATGDIFRAANSLAGAEHSATLDSAIDYMRRGELVPDLAVVDLVRERLRCLRCAGGFLLDGFPRTIAQAEALAELMVRENIPLEAVLNFEMPIEKIVARLSGRRTCFTCKAVFHLNALPPRLPGTCDHCGTKLQQREDDRPAAIRVRMEAYEKSTKPLVDYYQRRGLLVTVQAEGTPEEICRRAIQALEGFC
jgi:adenylate kinase